MPSAPSIDKASPVPYYHQLKVILREDIERRRLVAGDHLPGDHELCQRFGVSRTVVRQALAELEYEGVLERVRGRGTFVAPGRTGQGLVQSLTGMFEDLSARGRHLRSEILRNEVEAADAVVAAELQVPVGTPVVALERLRFVEDEAWVLVVTHLPAAVVPGLTEEDLRDRSLYALLRERYGVQLAHGRRAVEAQTASPRLAKELGICRGAPVLVLRSVSSGADGRPVETFTAHHRGDRSRFEVSLEQFGGASQSGPGVVVLAEAPLTSA